MELQLQPSATRTDHRPRIESAERSATLVEPNPPRRSPTSGLARQVARVGAKARLQGELRAIAIDLLGPNESDEFPAACADWVAATTEATVSRVSDSALEALVQGSTPCWLLYRPMSHAISTAREPGTKPDSTEPAFVVERDRTHERKTRCNCPTG